MKRNYLDNPEIYIELCFWKLKIYAFKNKDIKPSNEIGKAISLTTVGLSKHSKFNQYTWKEDMIGSGIETMIKGIFNFNEQEFKNPHGYMSMSAENAFLQIMEKEDRELLAIYKTFLTNYREGFEDEGLILNTDDEQFVQTMVDKVTEIEAKIERKKTRRKYQKIKREITPLSYLIYGDDFMDKVEDEIKKTETFYTNRKIDYGERGKLLIEVKEIKEKLGITIGSICVGDVIDYLVTFRKMEIENNKLDGKQKLDIVFVLYDNREFVDINWGYDD